jgi:hypothetical protein
VHARLCVGVYDAHFRFQPIGVAEEQAQDVAEVGHEPVGRSTSEKSSSDLVEGFERCRFQRQVIESPSTEHRHLALVLGVVRQLEHFSSTVGPTHTTVSLNPSRSWNTSCVAPKTLE